MEGVVTYVIGDLTSCAVLTICWILLICVADNPILFNCWIAIGEDNEIPIEISCCIICILDGDTLILLISWTVSFDNCKVGGKVSIGTGGVLVIICNKILIKFCVNPILFNCLIPVGESILIPDNINCWIIGIADRGIPELTICCNVCVDNCVGAGALLIGIVGELINIFCKLFIESLVIPKLDNWLIIEGDESGIPDAINCWIVEIAVTGIPDSIIFCIVSIGKTYGIGILEIGIGTALLKICIILLNTLLVIPASSNFWILFSDDKEIPDATICCTVGIRDAGNPAFIKSCNVVFDNSIGIETGFNVKISWLLVEILAGNTVIIISFDLVDK